MISPIAFYGSISVQSTLPYSTAEDVKREVKFRKENAPNKCAPLLTS